MKMWGGRFGEEPDESFLEFSSSASFDVRLYPYDLECTRAWAGALAGAGIISSAELSSIESSLDAVASELGSGAFAPLPSDEDIHTAIERRLVELAGDAAGKVRTGRSRNDQVATDMRLFTMDACESLSGRAKELQSALLDQADAYFDVIVPGHTHLQQAQPVLLAHVMLAFVQMLQRDVGSFAVARSAADCMPLGSGALAGTGFDIDTDSLASALGFTRVSANSLDAVSDRDFELDLMHAMSKTMVHLSRLAEQVILWASAEWGLAVLCDAWSTGSSLMPQKKNPDAAELVRGKTGRVLGAHFGLLTVMKGLPLAYNRDMQEDKEGLFDAFDTTAACLKVMERTLATMSFDRERAAELASGGFMAATDLADYLAARGMGFPQAHEVVGQAVAYCLQEGKTLEALTLDELARFSELLGADALEQLTPASCVARRACRGGTAPDEVRARIEEARKLL